MSTNRAFTVIASEVGTRLDLYLTLKLSEYSRSYLKNLINTEQVLVNNAVEFHPQYRVKLDDQITLKAPTAQTEKAQNIKAVPINLDIVFEDDNIIAVNKPAGMVVHPGSGHWEDTLANGIKYYLQKKGDYHWNDSRVGQIHRIDGPTSGLIIYAKTPKALWLLSQQFAKHTVNKHYLAIVKGLPPAEFRINNKIGRDKQDQNKMSSNSRDGRTAITNFIVKAVSHDGQYSLIQAEPKTGRTHQIRVHLAEAGFPIVGDTKYGGDRYKRLLLHAWRIELAVNDIDLKLTAPPEKDFLDALSHFGFADIKKL